MARPTDLSQSRMRAIVDQLKVGAPRAHAAENSGISRATLYVWLQLGAEARACRRDGCSETHHGPFTTALDGPSYIEFLDAVEQGEAFAVASAQRAWTSGWLKDWRAAKDWLEARYPREYKPSERVEVSGPGGGPIEVADARERLLRRLEAVGERLLSEAAGSAAEPEK